MKTRCLPGLAATGAVAVLFLAANRDAYQGYFRDDELRTISLARTSSLGDSVKALLLPQLLPDNVRPLGRLYFQLAGTAFGLNFSRYLIPLHALHVLNVSLVWLLARRLGVSLFAASAAAVLFGFHMAAFDAYWKPLLALDVLCATFTLLSLLLFTCGRWVWSCLAFWLALKAKEIAIMLPAVLACYELWLGNRRWKALAPFFAVGIWFGVQRLLLRSPQDGADDLNFTLLAFRNAAAYYSNRILLIPFGGVVLLVLPLFIKDRRLWLGITAVFFFFAPLAVLPEQFSAGYCYVPLTGLAVALGALADTRYRPVVVVFLVLWIPWSFLHLRLSGRATLSRASENRIYISALEGSRQVLRQASAFIYDNRPFSLRPWGIEGALRMILPNREIRLLAFDAPGAAKALERGPAAVLTWDPVHQRLHIAAYQGMPPETSYIDMNACVPLWQLLKGWYPHEGGFRWIEPVAAAVLNRPPQARTFELVLQLNSTQLHECGTVQVHVLANGALIGVSELREAGVHRVRWPVKPGGPNPARIEFRVDPPYRVSPRQERGLGIAIVGFGFLPKEEL